MTQSSTGRDVVDVLSEDHGEFVATIDQILASQDSDR